MDVLHGTDGLHGCTNETVAELSISLKTAGQAREAKGRGGEGDGWMEGGIEDIYSIHALRILHTYHTHTHAYMCGVCPLLL